MHGACYGAWCSDRLSPELAARRLQPLAIDLPTEDPAAGNIRIAEIIVAAQRPLRRLVYLCSLIPQPGKSGSDWIPEAGVALFDWGAYQIDHGDGTTSRDVGKGAEHLHPLSQ